MSKTVVVAMSGGVDSSVAAAILKEQGYNVIGITLNVWSSEECNLKSSKSCCSVTDIDDARNVCFKLGIPHYVLNMREIFQKCVIGRYLEDYKHGRTPNPCIECNRFVKFEALVDKAEALGADYVATGHYALIEHDLKTDNYLLKRAEDHKKDQTYVLYMLNQRHLKRLLLPIGEYDKPKIRAIAQRYGLSISEKPDSQDLCFTGEGGHSEFIRENCADVAKPGLIMSTKGAILGKHMGIHGFTIGQRKGIGISSSEPLYVTKIDPTTATVYVGGENELYSTEMEITDLSFVAQTIQTPFIANVKIRYKAQEVQAEIIPNGDTVKVIFTTPQRAITSGQAAVFYDGDYVIGGGTIK